MAVISKGQTFATGDQVTALKLNNLADNATFAAGAVDNVSTQLSGGAIVVKDGGVTTAKLNDGAVTTAKITDANVTFAKLTDVIDDDTMATASATTLATSESIKAYVDSLLIFTQSFESSATSIPAINTSTTVAHGLGVIPKLFKVTLICETAENGWAIGEEADLYVINENHFLSTWANTTDIGFRRENGIYLLYKNTTSYFTINTSNWKLIFRAWA
jgi:hypothetical protein